MFCMLDQLPQPNLEWLLYIKTITDITEWLVSDVCTLHVLPFVSVLSVHVWVFVKVAHYKAVLICICFTVKCMYVPWHAVYISQSTLTRKVEMFLFVCWFWLVSFTLAGNFFSGLSWCLRTRPDCIYMQISHILNLIFCLWRFRGTKAMFFLSTWRSLLLIPAFLWRILGLFIYFSKPNWPLRLSILFKSYGLIKLTVDNFG